MMIKGAEALIQRVQVQLESILNRHDIPSPLIEAMQYSVLGGGKRIRPMLVYLACEALDTDLTIADKPASAIELIHAYSLIHDDLPAMDDDDLRRGQASYHLKFDEATAILAGDALQTLAFETLSSDTSLSSDIRLKLVHELALAAGASGMVAGQTIDMTNENKAVDASSLEHMHRRKTGDLIVACLKFGALISNADSQQSKALVQYGLDLGLAFQIRDDILDVTGDEQAIGKPLGSDLANQKSTFVSVYGIDEAASKLDHLLDHAIESIESFGEKAKPLKDMALFIINRSY